MNLKERLDALMEYTQLNAASFSKKIGVKTAQTIYEINSGRTKNLSPKLKEKILACYPEISPSWLLTGEGEMLRSDEKKNAQVVGNINETQLAGVNVDGVFQNNLVGDNFHGDSLTVNKFNEEFFSLLKKKDEEIDRLLSIIERIIHITH